MKSIVDQLIEKKAKDLLTELDEVLDKMEIDPIANPVEQASLDLKNKDLMRQAGLTSLKLKMLKTVTDDSTG